MAGDTDDAESAAERLEAALERLAALAGTPRSMGQPSPDSGPTPPVEEIAERLDGLIDRLRTALGGRPD